MAKSNNAGSANDGIVFPTPLFSVTEVTFATEEETTAEEDETALVEASETRVKDVEDSETISELKVDKLPKLMPLATPVVFEETNKSAV